MSLHLLATYHRLAVGVLAALALTGATSGCAPEDGTTTGATSSPSASGSEASPAPSAADACAPEQLNLVTPGTLTIATDAPAYEPWFKDNDPTNGQGFESAVAWGVAKKLGFKGDSVRWVTEPFNKSYAPGDKDFDFDINQISITPARAQVVDFSTGYYQAAQAVVVLKDSDYADIASLDDLGDARIGAQVGTTSLAAAQDVIASSEQVAVFDDTNAAKQALLNGQIDAIIVDLPTAFYITAAEIPGSTVGGQFPATSGDTEEFGLLFQKGNPLTTCVDKALAELDRAGRLDSYETRWLSQTVDVPELS
ncbi:MAG: ABC transporter substrate-binding protein [Nocardioidaceae bacterium]